MFHVSTIQHPLTLVASPQEFYERVHPLIERAATNGAQLVVLPNYTGLMLLGVIVRAEQKSLALGELARAGNFATVSELLCTAAPGMRDFYLQIFSTLAKRARVFLAPGTVVEMHAGRLYNTAYLFTPEGTVVGSQKQTHRTSREIAWGLSQGEELSVWDIGDARIGFVVGTDVAHPEVARILALQNANLLIHPAAYPTYHDEYFLLDLWRDVQGNQIFGVQSCAGGEFRGKSAIYAPVEMTRAHTGILAQATSADGEEIIRASLDFDALQKNLDAYSVFDFFNYGFYARAFPSTYRGRV
jgi:predicted amidohydrolase